MLWTATPPDELPQRPPRELVELVQANAAAATASPTLRAISRDPGTIRTLDIASDVRRGTDTAAPRPMSDDEFRNQKRRQVALAIEKAEGRLSPQGAKELAMLRFSLEQHQRALDRGRTISPTAEMVAAMRQLLRQDEALVQELSQLNQALGAARGRKRRG